MSGGEVLKLSVDQPDRDGGWKDRLQAGLGAVGAGVIMVGALAEVPRAVVGAAGKLTGGPEPDVLKNDQPTLEALAAELAPSQQAEAVSQRRQLGKLAGPRRSRILGRPEEPAVPMSPREPATS